MLSRTADSLYWLGRYMERAGNTARALQVALREAGMGGGRPAQGQGWRALLLTSGDIGLLQGFDAAPDAAQIIQHLVMDRANPSSIQSCIEASRQNARQVRTALTVDMWEAVNDTWGQMRRMENAMPILVFNFKREGNIERAIVHGEPLGTWVANQPRPTNA